jgi:uncharacterized protein (UPF0335 family)
MDIYDERTGALIENKAMRRVAAILKQESEYKVGTTVMSRAWTSDDQFRVHSSISQDQVRQIIAIEKQANEKRILADAEEQERVAMEKMVGLHRAGYSSKRSTLRSPS